MDWLRERFYALLHLPDTEEDEWEIIVQRQLQIRDELQRMLLALIDARRRAAPSEQPGDVLGMLVRARDEQGQPLTDEQLLAHVNILLVAGHETTTTLGAWLLYLLATHAEYGARVDQELATRLGGPEVPLTSETVRSLPLLASAVREAGRLQSPVQLLPRGVVSPFDFDGYSVSAGTPVFLAIAAGHRLPTVFAEPDGFDPDRFLPPREEDKRHPYALATFGGGPRICLGINFAHVEAMALAAHVRRALRLEPFPDVAIEQIGGIVQTLPHGIRVRVRPLA